MTLDLPRIIGHRGAALSAPENTLAGFRRAAAAGARWVEFDVKLARDGEPILMHDETLNRTTNGRGRVRETPLGVIRTLDAGGSFSPEFAGEKVPLLEEALACLAELRMGYNLEIKPCPGRASETAAAAIAVVRRFLGHGLPAPILSSFDRDALAAAQAIAPDLMRGYLAHDLAADWLSQVKTLGCRTIHLGRRRLTATAAAAVRAAGYPLVVWTVNDPQQARSIVKWGADSLITDAPGEIAAAL